MRKISGTAALLFLLAAPAWPEPVRITGRVEQSARIELRSYPATQGEALATARPATDGSFSLSAPEAGFYRVIVRANGVPDLEFPLVPLVDEVELPPARQGESDGRTERFPRWRAVQERTPPVRPATERTGFVLDAVTRKPIAGALVWQQSGSIFSWTRSGADGGFRVAAEAGRPLEAAAPGYARAVRPEVPPDAPVSLALKPAVDLTGSVVDAEGRPVAGAAVQAVLTDPYPYYSGLRDLMSGFTRDRFSRFRRRIEVRPLPHPGLKPGATNGCPFGTEGHSRSKRDPLRPIGTAIRSPGFQPGVGPHGLGGRT